MTVCMSVQSLYSIKKWQNHCECIGMFLVGNSCKLLSGMIQKPTNILVRTLIFMAKTSYRDVGTSRAVGTNNEAEFITKCNKTARLLDILNQCLHPAVDVILKPNKVLCFGIRWFKSYIFTSLGSIQWINSISLSTGNICNCTVHFSTTWTDHCMHYITSLELKYTGFRMG